VANILTRYSIQCPFRCLMRLRSAALWRYSYECRQYNVQSRSLKRTNEQCLIKHSQNLIFQPQRHFARCVDLEINLLNRLRRKLNVSHKGKWTCLVSNYRLDNPSRRSERHDEIIMHFLHLLYKRRQNINGFSPHFSRMKDGRFRLCVQA
jgi:hypothetical protein